MKRFLLPLVVLAAIVCVAFNGWDNGDLKVDGQVYYNSVFTRAYVSIPDTTITSSTGTWYREQSIYVNSLDHFSIVNDSLQYDNGDGYLLILLCGSFTSDTNNTGLSLGVGINGNEPTAYDQNSVSIKASGDYENIIVSSYIDVNTGDKISILLKSDKAGAVIQPSSFQAIAIAMGR